MNSVELSFNKEKERLASIKETMDKGIKQKFTSTKYCVMVLLMFADNYPVSKHELYIVITLLIHTYSHLNYFV